MSGQLCESAFADIKITGDTLDLKKLQESIPLIPDYAYQKGTAYIDKYAKTQNEYCETAWIKGIKLGRNVESYNEQCVSFLQLFEDTKPLFLDLALECDIFLWITFFTESPHFYYRFSSELIKKCAEFGMSIYLELQLLTDTDQVVGG